ncbi:MAG: 2-isopropylmalate synthase [bacterium]|nr:MAG: 2-isopropylmalate synthase [bacterium]
MPKITIFDTTLRDGEQSPGFSMNIDEKLQLAHQLAALRVDVIEAGFPVSSSGDCKAVNEIAKKVKGPVICGLARMLEKDIKASADALKPAARKRIHVFISTSDVHIKYQLKKTKTQVTAMTRTGVKLAKRFTKDVEFSCMDATRTDPKFLYDIIAQAVEAGATTVNIPDTVGYTVPEEFCCLIDGIIENVPDIKKAALSVHCHNDLGLAAANSLAAVNHGVRQIECTINGIGERAGNASLEEIVMAIKTRRDFFKHSTGINTTEIYKTSKLLTAITGVPVQPNKAIVGENAFAHEAGIHQDGVIKRRETYEIMTPRSIGLKDSRMVLGKHSGRAAFRKKMKALGFKLDGGQLDAAFVRFKQLADKKKKVFDEDLEAVAGEEIATRHQTYELVYFHAATGSQTIPTATVKLKKKDGAWTQSAIGAGPIDAIYNAIDSITGLKGKLVNYSVRAATADKDAVGEVTVQVEFEKGVRVRGISASTDTVEASTRAYVNALNRAFSESGG